MSGDGRQDNYQWTKYDGLDRMPFMGSRHDYNTKEKEEAERDKARKEKEDKEKE